MSPSTLSTFVFHLHMVNTHLQSVNLAVSKYSCWVASHITHHTYYTLTHTLYTSNTTNQKTDNFFMPTPKHSFKWPRIPDVLAFCFAGNVKNTHFICLNLIQNSRRRCLHVETINYDCDIFPMHFCVFSSLMMTKSAAAYSRPAAGTNLCDP